LRLAAVFKFADKLSDSEISQVLVDLSSKDGETAIADDIQYEMALKSDSAKTMAQLFRLSTNSVNTELAAKAFVAFMKRVPDMSSRQRFMYFVCECSCKAQ